MIRARTLGIMSAPAMERAGEKYQHHIQIAPMSTFLQGIGCLDLVKIMRSLSRNGLIHPADLSDVDACDIPELIQELKCDGINIGDRNRIRKHCTTTAFSKSFRFDCVVHQRCSSVSSGARTSVAVHNSQRPMGATQDLQPSTPTRFSAINGGVATPINAKGSPIAVLLPNTPMMSPLQIATAALAGAQHGSTATTTTSSPAPLNAPVLNINYAKPPQNISGKPATSRAINAQGTMEAHAPRTGKRMKPERCKSCGQTDHVRRTRSKCPAHPRYNPKDYTLESKLYKTSLDATSAFAADDNLLHPPTVGNWVGKPGYRCQLCHRRSETVGPQKGFDYRLRICGGCTEL